MIQTQESIGGATITEKIQSTRREAGARRRALASDDAQLLAQIERRRAQDQKQKALFAAGLRRQAMGR